MFKLLRRGVFLGGAAYCAYDFNTDEQLILRSMRTLSVGFQLLYNYKIKFSPENVDTVHDDMARALYNLCNNNDGLYVKFGQQVAASEHTIPPVFYKYFCKLQDQAKFAPKNKIEKVLAQEFGEDYMGKVFSEFDLEPIAAASIAQVHKAKLIDGREVAVKIQKPNIKRQFKSDMFFHYLFCYVMGKAFDLPLLDFQQSIEENLQMEIDFRIEAANTERTRHDVQNKLKNKNIYVPEIIHKYDSQRVMVMEWIDGIKITDQEQLQKQNYDIEKLVQNSIEFFAEQIFISGFVHCDPHPGNLLARKVKDKNGNEQQQVVVLDYGLCFPLKEEFRLKYCSFWENLFLGNFENMKKIIADWGIGDEEMFASAQLLRPYNKEKHINEKISQEDVYKMQSQFKEDFKKMMQDTNKFPDELIFIGRNMNLVRSLNKKMGSPVNRINVMAKYAVKGQQYVNINKQSGLEKQHSRYEINQEVLSQQIIANNTAFFQHKFSVFLFQCRLFLSGVVFKVYQFWLKKFRNSNVEEVLDNVMANIANERFGQYGLKIDETSFSG